MNSSTSSSKKTFLKIFLVALGGMGLAMGGPRLFTELNDVNGATILDRVTQGLKAVPRVASEEADVVIAFGSSMTDAGFAARQFDRELQDRGATVKSFNYGFGGLNPYFQDYVARRMREGFEAKDKRVKLAILEFCPFQVTQARWQGAKVAADSFVSILASPQERWLTLLEEPARGAQLLNIHYLRDDVSAEMITWFFGRPLRPGRPRSDLPKDDAAAERRGEIGEVLNERFAEDYPDFPDDVDWYYPWQGAGTIPEERSQDTVDLLAEYHALGRTERRLTDDRLHRINCCDIEEMHFEEELVQAYVRMVKEFQSFSDHVEVIMLPRNTEWIRYTPDGQARLDSVLERLERETGIAVKNFQQIDGITAESFHDTTHLSRYEGDVVFTSFLVDQYAPLFGADAAPSVGP